MASKARADAARRNGAKSKGPVTAEGKARSSKNAITNGLYTDLILLPGENHELFAHLHQVLTDIHKPRNEEECMLVRDLVHNRWRIERMRQLQAAAIDDEMTQQRPVIDSQYKWMDGATRGSRAIQKLCDESGTVEMYERVETRLQNAILRLGKYIRDLQDRTPGAGQPGAGGSGTIASQQQQQSGGSATPAATSAGPTVAASGPLTLSQNLGRNFFLPQEEATPRTRRSRAPKPAILSPEIWDPEIKNEPSEPETPAMVEAPKYFVAGAASSPGNEYPAIGNEPSDLVAAASHARPSNTEPAAPKNEYPAIGNEPSDPQPATPAEVAKYYSPEPALSLKSEYPPTGTEPSELTATASYGAATLRQRWFAPRHPRPSKMEQSETKTARFPVHPGGP